MRLGERNNSWACEFEMQDVFERYALSLGHKVKREIHIPSTPNQGRIADFLLFVVGHGLVNVEAKCHPSRTLMQQLDAHAIYCDYSFAFIADYCLTPKWFKRELAEKGYGLIVFNYRQKTVTEVLEAHQNKVHLESHKILGKSCRKIAMKHFNNGSK